jgi:hypothetical protein
VATIRQEIFELLADGKERSSAQIAEELHETRGRKQSSVITACSSDLRFDRRVTYRQEGRVKIYSIVKGESNARPIRPMQ